MTGWVEHDGRGVPPDAKPGITLMRFVRHERARAQGWADADAVPQPDGSAVCIWDGDADMWSWEYFGTRAPCGSIYSKCTHYRNPSTDAAVEALKALADNPKRKVKEAMR